MNPIQSSDGDSSDPLSMRPFFIIWIGQAFSLLGSQLVQFALVWWLTRTTGSATVLAYASLVALLPQVFIGPLAGALVDRHSRRMVLINADAFIALATLGLMLLFWLGIAQVWHIYAIMFIRSLGAAFHWPAMQASTTLMVPQKHLGRVAGMNQTIAGLAGILIPPLGALAIEKLPMQIILSIDVLTALLAICPLFFILIPHPIRKAGLSTTDTGRSLLADMREGLHFVMSWKGLWMFAAIGMVINLLGRAALTLLPILVTEHFGGGALEFGWMQSAVGIGAVIGGVTLGVWGGFKRRILTVLSALVLDGIVISVIALTPVGAFNIAVVAILMAGFLETIVFGMSGAVGQAIIPPEMQGRVFSLLSSLGQVMAPLGLAIAGPAADAIGVQYWWLLTGIIIIIMGAGAFLVPSILHLEDRTRLGFTSLIS
jgi:DHA3 family macrolide efflux protein-like MFS transporter